MHTTLGKGLSRRSLLKGMGVGMAGLAASSLGVNALASTLGLPAGANPDLLWDYQIPGNLELFRTPVYHNGSVVLNLLAPGLGADVLRAVDIQSQQALWSVQLNDSHTFDSVTFGDGIVFARADASAVMAIDFLSGQFLWQQSYDFAGPISVFSDRIIITTADGVITALSIIDGSPIWKCPTGQHGSDSDTPTAVMPANGQFYVGLNGWLFAVDPATGKLNTAMWIGGQVYGPLSADSQYIYCTNSETTLFAVDPKSATKAWSWKASAQLSAPIAYCGLIYLVAQDGFLHVIDPVHQKPYTQLALNPFTEFNPFFIDDGVVYVTCIKSSNDSKLFAIDLGDLIRNEAQVVSFDLGSLGKVFGVENGIVYFSHNGLKNVAAVNVAQQLHQFFCESELMADNYVKNSSGAAQPSTPAFRTHVQLLDANKNPRINKSVKITASGPIKVTSNGKTQQVDTNTPIWLTTDAAGEFSIVSQAESISSEALYLWGNFMDVAEAIVIYPDHDTLNTLSQVPAEGAGGLSTAASFDGTQLLPKQLSDPSGLASAIRNTIGGSAQSVQLTRQRQVQLAAASASAPVGRVGAGHRRRRILKTDPTSYIAFPGSTPNMLFQPTQGPTGRIYVPGPIKNWQATFSADNVTFTALDSPPPPRQLLGLSWDDFWNDVVNGVRKIISVIVRTAEDIIHEITDDLNQIYLITIDSIERAVSVVAGFFKTLVGDIEKAIEWLSFIFDWKQFLATKDQLKSLFQGACQNLTGWIDNKAVPGIHNFFTDLEGDIESLLKSPPSGTGSMQSLQKNGNDPQALYGHGGAKSYTKTRWITEKFKQNASSGGFNQTGASGSGKSLASVAEEAAAAFQKFFTDIGAQLKNSNFTHIPGDISRVFNDVAGLFRDPSNFITHSLSDITALLVDVAVGMLKFVDAVIESSLELVAAMVNVILDFLTIPINIPVISDLYELISGDPLSLLDVCCLIAAIPTTILLKFVHLVGASQGAGNIDLTANVGYVVVAALYSIVDALSDLIGEPPVPLITGAALALGVIQMGLGFPTDLATNNSASYVVYALQALPMIGVLLETVVPPPAGTAIGLALPQGLCLYGFTMFFLSIGLGAKFPVQFPLLAELQNIFASIPYIAKPLSNGENPPGKIALGVIDGVCDFTAVGLSIAQWA